MGDELLKERDRYRDALRDILATTDSPTWESLPLDEMIDEIIGIAQAALQPGEDRGEKNDER